MRGGTLICRAPRARGSAQGPQQFDDLVDGQSGAGLGLAGDRERGEHDRDVGVDAVAEQMKDRSGGQVGLGHAE
jgi:hypothetical protein